MRGGCLYSDLYRLEASNNNLAAESFGIRSLALVFREPVLARR